MIIMLPATDGAWCAEHAPPSQAATVGLDALLSAVGPVSETPGEIAPEVLDIVCPSKNDPAPAMVDTRTPEQRAAEIVPLLSPHPEYDAESNRIIAATIREAERVEVRRLACVFRRELRRLEERVRRREGRPPSARLLRRIETMRAVIAALEGSR